MGPFPARSRSATVTLPSDVGQFIAAVPRYPPQCFTNRACGRGATRDQTAARLARRINRMTGMAIEIGIDDTKRKEIAEGLARLLADTYTLYLTTHNFHWNVTGRMFNSLHAMFMVQYTELWNAVDPIAERIRSLAEPAPGSYAQFAKLSSLADAPETPPRAEAMIQILVDGHQATARSARSLFPVADEAGDQATEIGRASCRERV